MKIVVDIWSGPRSQEHVARFILDFEDAMEVARDELRAGNLVNLRSEAEWGDYSNFDIRKRRLS